MTKIAPYGSWRSPITPTHYATGEKRLQQLHLSGEDLYWAEIRPHEGGRYAIVRRSPDGATADALPPGFDARTLAHEYGGGAFFLAGGTLFFSNFADQRLYRLEPGQAPRPITPEPAVPAGDRYADAVATADGKWIICVLESHSPDGQVTNELVCLPSDGSTGPKTIAGGHDFFSSPRLSPDGRRLAWLAWDFPQMPWDGTELWVADWSPGGSLRNERRVAGGPRESIFQPEWDPEGRLTFISDRTDWWNLYREQNGEIVSLAPLAADLGYPQWGFGYSRYCFLSGGRIVCVFSRDGFDHLGLILPGSHAVEPLTDRFTCFYPAHLISDGRDRIWFTAGSPTESLSVVTMEISSGYCEVLARSVDQEIDPGYLSRPRPIAFPTDGGHTAHALFYPPTNPDFSAPHGERPPLAVCSHGGPTSTARPYLDPDIHYFTSRGLAVVDVNYGGSTGYGRAYRERLNGQWGVVDVADCVHAARYLAATGEVDGARLAIRGGSAGGYTTLCALAFYDDFAVGASYFGVADLETFVRDTHKFESRYMDTLVGPYPEALDIYRARSPIHFTDRFSCPIILFQGLEDKIVPPSQAESMVEALKAKGLPYAYLAFEGEQHGFRRKETNERCLEAELYFYGRILGFEPDDKIEPVRIENL